MRCFPSRPSGFALALPALLALAAAPCLAQMPAPVSGVITTAAGRPLAGATVSSGAGSAENSTTTGADGRFQLADSTSVLHAQLDGYQPLTLLIHPPADDLRLQLHAIALAPLTGAVLAPPCAPLPPKDRTVLRLGTPGGLHFTVPRKGWDLRSLGQGDLHEYVLTPRHSRAHLTLWFGANAIQPLPEDRFFLESAAFAQRAIVVVEPGMIAPHSIGVDSYGTFPTGDLWRHLATPGSGATYDYATPANAAAFDAIIATLCVTPAS
jgi:hypothetical protein